MAYKQLLIVCALVFAFGPARSQVIVVDGNKATKENNRNAAISDATAEDEARFGSQLDPLEYFINVTIRNYASSEAKVQQRYLFPDGVEIKSFTLHNDGYRAKRSAENQRLTQWVGGMVNLKPSDTKEAYMTYINHPAEVINVNTKTFHRLSTTIMIKEGDLVGGQISSPNYPVSYPNGADVTWLIAYPENNKVMLQMINYATEECCDHVFVYDGYSESRHPLATFEGYYSYGSDNIVLSTQPAMFIRFTSDCLVTNTGFLASYINQPVMSCGNVQEISGNEGYILSPNYPSTYDDNMNCTWSVQTYYNTRVKFVLDNFTIGYDDQVNIYDGTPSYPGNLIATLYGTIYPGYTVDASSYQAFVIFMSGTSSFYSNMFNISYTGVSNYPETTTSAPMSCGYVHTTNGNSGYIESPNYPNTYGPYMDCTWSVQTYYNTRVTFVVDYMSTGSDDQVAVYEGTPSNSGDLIVALSGSFYGSTYYALSNQAYVVFTSGYSTNYNNKFNISYYGDYIPETTQATDSCGYVDYTGSYTGYIYSPNYPNAYPANSDCTWTVATASGTEVTFNVRYFDLRSGDYVYIYGGTPTESNFVKSMTGSYYYGYTINADSNEAFIRFVSGSYTYNGYYFRFSFYGTIREGSGDEGSGGNYYNPAVCNGNSQSMSETYSGHIYSSGYSSPGYYPMNEYCIWYITTYSYYNSIIFYPHYFSTEYGYDWARIYNGHSTSPSNLISQISGYVTSGNTLAVTNSRYATFTFTSDNIITDRGINIHFYGHYTSYYTTASPFEETTATESCSTQNYYGSTGYLESPNYPNNYDINMQCNTYVNTPYETYVQLTVQSFYLNTGDYLQIYDGFTGEILTTLSGYYSYGYTWTASTNYIRLVFYSDSISTGSGYRLRYDALLYIYYDPTLTTPTCGGEMPYYEGNITSPNYPNNYYNNMDCVWTVAVSSNMYVLFTVVYFDTESGYDYVGFSRGTPENSWGQIRALTGYINSGYEIMITDNQAFVTFHTDGSVTDRGFNINYNAVPTYYVPPVRAASMDNENDLITWWMRRELEADEENDPKTLGKDLWRNAKNKPEHLQRKHVPIPTLNEIQDQEAND